MGLLDWMGMGSGDGGKQSERLSGAVNAPTTTLSKVTASFLQKTDLIKAKVQSATTLLQPGVGKQLASQYYLNDLADKVTKKCAATCYTAGKVGLFVCLS